MIGGPFKDHQNQLGKANIEEDSKSYACHSRERSSEVGINLTLQVAARHAVGQWLTFPLFRWGLLPQSPIQGIIHVPSLALPSTTSCSIQLHLAPSFVVGR